MDKIKKNFGFGCMRFPMIGEEIDEAQAEGRWIGYCTRVGIF